MSYCRWSSDEWRCDVYLYEDVAGGWTLHLAGNRPLGVPEVGPWPEMPRDMSPAEIAELPEFKAWFGRYEAQMSYLRDAPRQSIDHPLAGETFRLGTLEEVLEKLLFLRSEGFSFPDYVLEEIREEMMTKEEK